MSRLGIRVADAAISEVKGLIFLPKGVSVFDALQYAVFMMVVAVLGKPIGGYMSRVAW
jgi:hypothetical protein